MNIIVSSAPVAAAPAPPLVAPPLPMYRFTVEQYHAMIEGGVLTEDHRCELVEGWIIDKMTHKPPHDGCILLTQTFLLSKLPSEWVLRIQSSVTLADSEPEPDLVVARGPARRYCRQHPGPKEVGLLVEVADSTLVIDRDFKSIAYARARIPIYWIINLIDSRVEVFTEPRAGKSPSYRRRRDYDPEAAVPLILDGREIAQLPVSELLP